MRGCFEEGVVSFFETLSEYSVRLLSSLSTIII